MTHSFIPEHHVYQYLSQVGIKTPKYHFIDSELQFDKLSFAQCEPVVIKGMAVDLWHKSDHGALHFINFDLDAIKQIHGSMTKSVGEQFNWLGTLVTERVNIQSAKGAPSEIFVSLQRDKCCGAIISMGFGGLLTEEWARELKQSLLVWPASVYTPEEALEELEEHWLGKILLGNIRQQVPLTTTKINSYFLKKLWLLDELMAKKYWPH